LRIICQELAAVCAIMTEHPYLWQLASGVFFAYILATALLRPSTRRRSFALWVAGTGLAAAALSTTVPQTAWLHDWILPPTLLLVGYWSSGALFVSPMPRAERLLMAADRAFGIAEFRAPRLVAEVLEASYAGVYPIVALAFILHLVVVPSRSPERFWAVVLITDFICFGMLPWIQTRPPRALEEQPPWCASVRGFNLGLLHRASIHVNTFPSGHAAEAVAAALLVVGAPLPIVLLMGCGALAITAGAVLGRYHYALDALAGWIVAVLVWLAVA
jgi:membrane-associated phospholipid phosphatase